MTLKVLCLIGFSLAASGFAYADQQLVTLNDASTFPISSVQAIKGDRYVFNMPDGQTEVYPKTAVFCAASGCQTDRHLTLNGCPTIGNMLMPVSVADYAVNNEFNMGMRDWKNIHGEPSRLYSLVNAEQRQLRYVSLRAEGSGSGFKDFAEGKLNFVFASRLPTNKEAQTIYGVTSRADGIVKRNEHLIGYDAVRVVVHPDNPIRKLSIEQLSKIFSGDITNWSELGGDDLEIKAYVPPSDTAAYGMFKSKVMVEHDRLFDDEELTVLSSNMKLLRTVNREVEGIAFYAAGHQGRLTQNVVDIVDDCGVTHVADEFAIKTNEYPLAHRLYLYTHPKFTGESATELVDFIKSDRAQYDLDKVVGVATVLPARQAPEMSVARIRELTQSGNKTEKQLAEILHKSQRLSSTFNFAKDSADLSLAGRVEVGRLVRHLERNKLSRTKVMVLGFSSQQENGTSGDLALNRAKKVATALQEFGIKADVVKGLGDVAPVSCNTMSYQQHKNQRVEIWLQDKQSRANVVARLP